MWGGISNESAILNKQNCKTITINMFELMEDFVIHHKHQKLFHHMHVSFDAKGKLSEIILVFHLYLCYHCHSTIVLRVSFASVVMYGWSNLCMWVLLELA